MSTPVASRDGEPPSLRQLFLQGWEARRKIDTCELASGSAEHSVIHFCVTRAFTVVTFAPTSAEVCVGRCGGVGESHGNG